MLKWFLHSCLTLFCSFPSPTTFSCLNHDLVPPAKMVGIEMTRWLLKKPSLSWILFCVPVASKILLYLLVISEFFSNQKIKVSRLFLSFLGNQLSKLLNILLWFVVFEQRSYITLYSPCCPILSLQKKILIFVNPLAPACSCSNT